MTLRFEDGRPFASGAAPYVDEHPTDRSRSVWVVVQAEILGQVTGVALDTGGAYLVLDPEYVAFTEGSLGEPLHTHVQWIRGIRYEGDLYRVPVVVLADQGLSLAVEVTAFVPRLKPGEEWTIPTILGLQGGLERFRFAVDPGANTWHFGSVAPGNGA